MPENVSKDTCDALHKGVDKALADIDKRLSSIEGYGKAILLALSIGLFMQFSGLAKPQADEWYDRNVKEVGEDTAVIWFKQKAARQLKGAADA